MIEITPKGLSGYDSTMITQLREEFTGKRCVVFSGLIQKELLLKQLPRINAAPFFENQHFEDDHVFAKDLTINGQNPALHQISFLLNNLQLFKVIEQITGCPPIKGFSGRIYRNMPGSGHHLDWHDDLSDTSRLIALSMNLSSEHFENGVFQIRKKGTDGVLREVISGNLGDTHIFAVLNKPVLMIIGVI